MNSGKTMLKITRCLYCMLLCFLFFTMPLAEAAKASTETRAAFPAVLMYHDIKTRPLNNFDVTREDFAPSWTGSNKRDTGRCPWKSS